VAALLIAVSLVVGAVGLGRELHEAEAATSALRRVPVAHGYGVPPAIGQQGSDFLAEVRRTVPPAEPVRIVQPIGPPDPFDRTGPPGVCGHRVAGGVYWWLVYALAPRASTCDPAARWTVYYGAEPAGTPPGATVQRFGPGLELVRR